MAYPCTCIEGKVCMVAKYIEGLCYWDDLTATEQGEINEHNEVLAEERLN